MQRLLPSVSDTKDLSAPPPVSPRPKGIISTSDSKAPFEVYKRKSETSLRPDRMLRNSSAFRWESAVSSSAPTAAADANVAVVRAPATGFDTPPVTTTDDGYDDDAEAVPAS